METEGYLIQLNEELSKNQSLDRCTSYREMIELLRLNHQKISNCDDKNSCVFSPEDALVIVKEAAVKVVKVAENMSLETETQMKEKFNDNKFVETLLPSDPALSVRRNIFALDCEMVITK